MPIRAWNRLIKDLLLISRKFDKLDASKIFYVSSLGNKPLAKQAEKS